MAQTKVDEKILDGIHALLRQIDDISTRNVTYANDRISNMLQEAISIMTDTNRTLTSLVEGKLTTEHAEVELIHYNQLLQEVVNKLLKEEQISGS